MSLFFYDFFKFFIKHTGSKLLSKMHKIPSHVFSRGLEVANAKAKLRVQKAKKGGKT